MMRSSNMVQRITWCAAAIAGSCGAGHAQVIINEVFENPPGDERTDSRWEFVELYGRPCMNLSGYAVVLFKGGMDVDRDGRIDANSVVEIDEAFSLDGCSLDEHGLFLLVNSDAEGVSHIGDLALRRNPAYDWRRPDGQENRRWLNGLSFGAAHIASDHPAGLLDNEGSSTYMLVRARPGYSMGLDGRSVYASEYGFRKGVKHDSDMDARIDRWAAAPSAALQGSGVRLEPFQMVDEVAWSHRAGKEYVRDRAHRISDTPALNPDALMRISIAPSWAGYRTADVRDAAGLVSSFTILPTTVADESFVYGVLDSRVFPRSLAYFDGYDIDGWPQAKAPTDPAAVRFDGSCDPEPDLDPFPPPCLPSIGGAFAFTDLPVTGLGLSPGAMNDASVPGMLRQFRFVHGDFDLDGVVTKADYDLISARVGAALDDRSAGPSEDAAYRWEGVELQQILMMLDMDRADADGGNAPQVTPRDVAAHAQLLRPFSVFGEKRQGLQR